MWFWRTIWPTTQTSHHGVCGCYGGAARATTSSGHLDHKVKLTGYPHRQRRNRLSVHEYEALKRQCTELFKEGKVRISKSPYAAPIVMVRKSDGSIRVCIDYRAINERTVKDSFPLPRIDDLIDQLRDATCITHLDLRSAYNQVRMSEHRHLK